MKHHTKELSPNSKHFSHTEKYIIVKPRKTSNVIYLNQQDAGVYYMSYDNVGVALPKEYMQPVKGNQLQHNGSEHTRSRPHLYQ